MLKSLVGLFVLFNIVAEVARATRRRAGNHGKTLNQRGRQVCYREHCKNTEKHKEMEPEEGVHRLHQSKSRELRASILYTGCQCEKRDGLQDDCPRTGCHGSPECLTKPPTCGPSEFCDGKHLGKKSKHSSHSNKNGKTKENTQNGKHEDIKAKYKCFPATVKGPVRCCSCP